METNKGEGYISWKNSIQEYKINVANILTVKYARKKDRIIIWYKYEKRDKIIVLNFNSDYLFDIIPPEEHSIIYFMETENDIFLVANQNELKNERATFKFKINLSNGKLSKNGYGYYFSYCLN